MAKIVTVFGTRPEAIKLAPLLEALGARNDRVQSRVCVTAQHRGMLDQMLAGFSVSPDYDLDVMTEGQSPSQVAARVLERLAPVLDAERPDWVVVQGDTTTTLAAALSAKYAGARVAHVEAGLRTFDRMQPFPEEINRQAVTRIADLHLAPTPLARRNLLREGVDPASVRVTGNTAIDALRRTIGSRDFRHNGQPWDHLPRQRRVILLTAHRRENHGPPLREICAAAKELAQRFDERVQIFYPVHPSGAVRRAVACTLDDTPNIGLLEPLDYAQLVRLMVRADLVITDSGGLQEEAPYLGKPVLVLRNVTERPEAIEAGVARLVGSCRKRIVTEATRLLSDPRQYARMARRAPVFGDGRAAERIARALLGEAVTDWTPAGAEQPSLWPFDEREADA
ncbi:MAG: UDP-N-acetylglucosamine 2-epimerase (non-hydrolyzing) [Candidatus Eisenbacteria bacterium]|nr:UDP-N-acetylglucosamine 2-epimerase (non-hydrolyzing) [Candidatus Eisenbacteria bacterium]